MYMSDFKGRELGYNYAQFLIAIVLDRQNEVITAKKVLKFAINGLPVSVCGIPRGSRGALVQYLEDKAANGENVQDRNGGVVRRRYDILDVTLNFYFSQKVFEANDRKGYCTLDALLRSVSKASLRGEVFKYAASFSVKYFIVLYTKTAMFRKQFENKVLHDLKRLSKRMDVSDSAVLEQLSVKFTQYVSTFCADGIYDPGTCTPDAFLFKKNATAENKASGPFFWFQMQNNGEYFNILKAVGTNSTVGGSEDLTIIETASVEQDKAEHTINFIGICSKIRNASLLLFNHANSKNAYYDIFSYHKQAVISNESNRAISNALDGCTISFDESADSICDGNENLKNKFNARKLLCAVFEPILRHPVGLEDIYRLYMENMECTRKIYNRGTKDGKLLYSYSDHVSKQSGGSNSNKFFTLLYGYLALKDLLDFLSRPNKYGVNMYNFPVSIFRAYGMLTKVKSFEEYIEFGSEILALDTEAKDKSKYNSEYLDGFWRNDNIYNTLSAKNLLKSDINIKAFADLPISSIMVTLEEFNQADDDFNGYAKKFLSEWDVVMGTFDHIAISFGLASGNSLFNIDALAKLTLQDINNLSARLQHILIGLAEGNNLLKFRDDLRIWYLAAIYCKVLFAATLYEGDRELTDIDGHYAFQGSDLLHSIYVSDRYECKDVNEFLWGRATGIAICCWLFWGEDSEINLLTNRKYVSTIGWEEYWSFWCIGTRLATFLEENNKLMLEFRQHGLDTEMMIILATGRPVFMSVPEQLTNVNYLHSIKKPSDPSFNLNVNNASLEDLKEHLEYQHRMNEKMLTAFNRLLRIMGDQIKVQHTLVQTVNSLLSDLGASGVHYDENEELLQDGLQVIYTRKMNKEFGDHSVRQYLAVFDCFDRDGFLVSNGRRICLQGRSSKDRGAGTVRYVHRAGFFVICTSVGIPRCDVVPISKAELEELRVELRKRGIEHIGR